MRRALLLFMLIWAVSACVLAAERFLSLTPMQRQYFRAEVESEALASLGFHVPLFNIGFDPHVAVVLVPSPGEPARLMAVPAADARRALRPLFPQPLLPDGTRIAMLAAVGGVALYVITLAVARNLARRDSRSRAAPPTGP